MTIYLLVQIYTNRADFSKAIPFVMQLGSSLAQIYIALIVSKIYLRSIDFFVLTQIGVRCIITFLMFKFIAEKKPHFELLDRKQLVDSMSFVALPSLLGGSANWKIDLLSSIPLTIAATSMNVKSAFAMTEDNMTCYADPESVAGVFLGRQLLNIYIVVHVMFSNRRSALNKFVQEELAKA